MKFLGMNEQQLFTVVLGQICLFELLKVAAPSAEAAFLGAGAWSLLSAGLFIRRNYQELKRSA